MRRLISAALPLALILSILIGGFSNAPAEATTNPALRKPFADHTLIYNDKESGLEFSVYLDRFGGFERYFPCQFDHGKWWVETDGKLCIKYERKNTKASA